MTLTALKIEGANVPVEREPFEVHSAAGGDGKAEGLKDFPVRLNSYIRVLHSDIVLATASLIYYKGIWCPNFLCRFGVQLQKGKAGWRCRSKTHE